MDSVSGPADTCATQPCLVQCQVSTQYLWHSIFSFGCLLCLHLKLHNKGFGSKSHSLQEHAFWSDWERENFVAQQPFHSGEFSSFFYHIEAFSAFEQRGRRKLKCDLPSPFFLKICLILFSPQDSSQSEWLTMTVRDFCCTVIALDRQNAE